MNYLHKKITVACWFELQSCIFLEPHDHDNGFMNHNFGEVMTQCLENVHNMPQHKADTDLKLVPKIASVLFKVREEHHAMSKIKNSSASNALLINLKDNAARASY